MTFQPVEILDEAPSGRVCALCRHAEDDHLAEEAEAAGTTQRRSYCEQCEDWHDLAIEPDDAWRAQT
jgi:hypothetical protein